MRFIGVFNSDGGTFRTTDMVAFCKEATKIFEAHGHVIDCRVVAGKAVLSALLEAARNTEIDGIVAGGGDGTVSSAANVAFHSGIPLAVIPAGTMNLFARSLHMPLAPLAALEAIAAGKTIRVDIATANGRTFVHHFGVGIHPRLVRIRDGMNYQGRVGKIIASVRAVWSAIVKPPEFRADIWSRKGIRRYMASGVNVTNNLVGEGHVPHADRLDQGVLGVYIFEPMKSLALVRLLARVMLGHWKDSPLVAEHEVREVGLHFPRRKTTAQAIIDGELIELEEDVILKIHPKALRVIVPQDAPGDAIA